MGIRMKLLADTSSDSTGSRKYEHNEQWLVSNE